MLKRLLLENVGPAPRMELDLGSRLNILTGDNGLGKASRMRRISQPTSFKSIEESFPKFAPFIHAELKRQNLL